MNFWIWALILFVMFDVLLVAFVLWKRNGGGLSDVQKREYLDMWSRIKNDSDLRHAVMDADKLLDRLLGHKGYSGSLGEKLKKSGSLFSDLNGVWSAHKLRNRLAHELDAKVSPKEGERALKQYARAFRDLGLL
ncbi:hypothetical protein KC725_05015 [Candidatus Peregrinibacteria bacterium]|nr:hypothetical protein [Candidatus Peregrinibacteria bacterium]